MNRPSQGDRAAVPGDSAGRARPFLGIYFKCCKVYSRIYRSADNTTYQGHCPRCGAVVKVPIGGGGTSRRFFEAS